MDHVGRSERGIRGRAGKALITRLLRIACVFVIAAVAIVLTQDLQIFPGMFRSFPKGPPPPGIESIVTTTADGESIEVWRRPGAAGQPLSGYTLIFMHGNFETVHSSLFVQDWFSGLGATTYTFDYRGFGTSTGWPSESGLYRDSAAVWEMVRKRDNIAADKLIIVGMSVGSGPAAELAAKLNPKVLALISPYSDLPSVAGQRAYLRPLLPFLWYRLPTAQYVHELEQTCIVLAHGKKDPIIEYSHSDRIAAAVKHKDQFQFISSDDAAHNDILVYTKDRISSALTGCVAPKTLQ